MLDRGSGEGKEKVYKMAHFHYTILVVAFSKDRFSNFLGIKSKKIARDCLLRNVVPMGKVIKYVISKNENCRINLHDEHTLREHIYRRA